MQQSLSFSSNHMPRSRQAAGIVPAEIAEAIFPVLVPLAWASRPPSCLGWSMEYRKHRTLRMTFHSAAVLICPMGSSNASLQPRPSAELCEAATSGPNFLVQKGRKDDALRRERD